MIFSADYTGIRNSVLLYNSIRNQNKISFSLQVAATDPDDGINGQISFTLAGGNDDGYFDLDTSTGQISLKTVILLGVNESKDFVLWITATDGKTRFQYRSTQLPPNEGFFFLWEFLLLLFLVGFCWFCFCFVFLKECCQNRLLDFTLKILDLFFLTMRRLLCYSSKVISPCLVKLCFLLMLSILTLLGGYGNLQNNISLTPSFNLTVDWCCTGQYYEIQAQARSL